jgi:hypothetical protein
VAQQPSSGQGHLSVEILRSYTTRHTRQDSSGRGIGPSQRPIPDNTQQSPETSMLLPGTRTRTPTTRAAAHPRLRSRGHRDRPATIIATLGITDTTLPSLLPYTTRSGFRPYADDQHEMLAQYYGSLQVTQEVLHSGATAGRYTTQSGKMNHKE